MESVNAAAAPATPRPPAHPTWPGIAVATIPVHTGSGYRFDTQVLSTGPAGRIEGYDSLANARRAARLISRGDQAPAVAILNEDDRYFVEGLAVRHPIYSGRRGPLRFEHALPTIVVGHELRENATAQARIRQLTDIIDGARNLEVTPLRTSR